MSCSKMDEVPLSSTVFVEDSYYAGLPIYSEWGYNTFGAYIDRKIFVSSDDEVPAKIFVNNDTLHFMLKGTKNYMPTSLTFSLTGLSPQTEFDLLALDDTTFNLKDSAHFVELNINNNAKILEIIEGELVFKRVQRLFIDEEMQRVIMSGTFRFKTFLDNEPAAVTNGRFDLGIGYENFFNF